MTSSIPNGPFPAAGKPVLGYDGLLFGFSVECLFRIFPGQFLKAEPANAKSKKTDVLMVMFFDTVAEEHEIIICSNSPKIIEDGGEYPSLQVYAH